VNSAIARLERKKRKATNTIQGLQEKLDREMKVADALVQAAKLSTV
jgi:hypothetical protein